MRVRALQESTKTGYCIHSRRDDHERFNKSKRCRYPPKSSLFYLGYPAGPNVAHLAQLYHITILRRRETQKEIRCFAKIHEDVKSILETFSPFASGEAKRRKRDAHLSLALPIDEETIFVDLECTVKLDFRVVLLVRPAIEDASGAERFRHFDLPVELELLRHVSGVYHRLPARSAQIRRFSASVNRRGIGALVIKASTR